MKPGEEVVALAIGWSVERFVQVKKVEEKPVKKNGKKKAAPAKKSAAKKAKPSKKVRVAKKKPVPKKSSKPAKKKKK